MLSALTELFGTRLVEPFIIHVFVLDRVSIDMSATLETIVLRQRAWRPPKLRKDGSSKRAAGKAGR